MEKQQANELIEVLAELRDVISEHNESAKKRLRLLEESNEMQREGLALSYKSAELQARLWTPVIDKAEEETNQQQA